MCCTKQGTFGGKFWRVDGGITWKCICKQHYNWIKPVACHTQRIFLHLFQKITFLGLFVTEHDMRRQKIYESHKNRMAEK